MRVAKPGKTFEGKLLLLEENALVLDGGEGKPPIVVPRVAVAKLDVRRRASKRPFGVVIGTVLGGIIGNAVANRRSGSDCEAYEIDFDRAICRSSDKISSATNVTVGLGLGALLGAGVTPGDRWDKNVPLASVHLSLGRTRGHGFRVSVAFAF